MTKIFRVVMLAAVLATAGLAATASAIVPPKNCGNMTIKHHPWHINADQIACKKARTYASRYIASHKRPSHFKCYTYKSALRHKCVNTRAKPDQTIFMIDMKYKG